MEIVQKVKLHNRFDIEVRDAKTGVLKQKAKAENIILNRLYTLLCPPSASNFFGYINFGSGTGTLDATRTTLFTHIAGISATTVETIKNTPPTASYVKKKIILSPSSYNGHTITEVGVSNDGSHINTHALITDSEGNQISIEKTSSDEITIYATIYVQLNASNYLVGFPNYNSLLNYLLDSGGGWVNILGLSNTHVYISVSADKTATNVATNYKNSNALGTVVAIFNSGNPTAKTISTPLVRFETSNGNGHIWSLVNWGDMNESPSLCRLLFPIVGIWEGYHFVGKQVGTGDGSTKTFNLPWSDINTAKGYTIYKNGTALTGGTDYALSNSVSTTSVTFTTAPASGDAIAADFWVDYVPKDSDHVLDIQLTIQFGEGAA